jgi:hypothetical protein
VLKNPFSTEKTCDFPKKFEGHFSKAGVFQHPVKGGKRASSAEGAAQSHGRMLPV